MTAPIGPRLDPFPWEDLFLPNTLPSYEYLSNDANDGVQLHVVLGGYAPSWEHSWSMYGPGLRETSQMYEHTIVFPAKYDTAVPGIFNEIDVGLWADLDHLAAPASDAMHKTDDQWWREGTGVHHGAVATAGGRVYPGVFSCTSYAGGAGALAATWMNQPISFESWFATNESRVDPAIGFNGYTFFGDQRNVTPSVPHWDPALPSDLYRRRYVCGVLKRTADLATCGPSDVMVGAIVTSDGANTTIQMCLNGAVVYSTVVATLFATTSLTYETGWSWFEGAWSGPAADMDVWAGTVDGFETTISSALGWYTIQQWDTAGDPYAIPCAGFDSYDVKWAWYIDDYSPTHPVGTPVLTNAGTTFFMITADTPTMSAHPRQDLPPQNTPSFWQDFVMSRETMSV